MVIGRDPGCKDRGQEEECGVPAELRDDELAERREDHLSERSRRRADTQHEGLTPGFDDPGHCREGDRKGGKCNPQPGQDAAEQRQADAGRGGRHASRTNTIDDRAGSEDSGRAIAVRQHARERYTEAPHEILDRKRKRKGLAVPAARAGHRLE